MNTWDQWAECTGLCQFEMLVYDDIPMTLDDSPRMLQNETEHSLKWSKRHCAIETR